jgi:vitamin B12 transporter
MTEEVAAPDPAGLVTSVTVVDRSTLAASNKSDLDKVVRGLPGVTLLRNIRGGLSAFSLRGANAGQGQLMLDGIPLYSTVASLYNLDAFAPEMLQRVEVVRGPAAIRYGSLAPGGTVRLFSR